ncbi:LolA family protein [Allostreptomyces psammosilenae]|uniref:Outer membrane lipoprotein-sorting protein n=1 Tax=Allostreptomyces psammosilenae TaxID=1892865 RepID=A0A852ZYP9_9ACTN|nr:DUF2092 domain-containing protein [Allostreptomyces psammosilenae]NYI05844.1 outer membrane lipoprotein-sorting protein [Allostreptomyces psammosilenae]
MSTDPTSPIDPTTPAAPTAAAPTAARSRRAGRAVWLPAGVAAVVAVSAFGVVPAIANDDPELAEISAEELLTRVAESDTETLSGTARASVDLGLPSWAETFLSGGESLAGLLPEDLASELPSDAASPLPGVDGPLAQLLTGGEVTAEVAADGPERQKVVVISEGEEYHYIHNGTDVWTYDSSSRSAEHTVLPEEAVAEQHEPLENPQEAIADFLAAVEPSTDITVDGTQEIAGRDAYTLKAVPRNEDSTVGEIRVGVDAETGVPLSFTLTARDGGEAVVDLAFTEISYDQPDADTFTFEAPRGTDVTETDLTSTGWAVEEELPEEWLEYDGSYVPLEPGAEPASWSTFEAEAVPAEVPAEGAPIEELEAELEASAELPSDFGAYGGHLTSGEDWGTVVTIPSGAGAGSVTGLVGMFGEEVSGDFGTGTLISSRLVNVLVEEDGTVHVGAVNVEALERVAAED